MDKKNDYVFEAITGQIYGCKPPSCLICEHCTDIYTDYTNGPYMIICALHYENEIEAGCKHFQLDSEAETIEQFEKRTGADFEVV